MQTATQLPDKVIDVPGIGVVSFPGSMPDADIAAVIKKQHPDLKAQSHGASGSWGEPMDAAERFQDSHPYLSKPFTALANFGRDVVGDLPTSVAEIPDTGKGGVIRDTAASFYHAFTDKPTDEEKKNIPFTLLPVKRLIVDPMRAYGEKSELALQAAKDQEKLTGKRDTLGRIISGVYGAGGTVPVVGPVGAHVLERGASGDPTGAAAEAAVLALAPDVISETKNLIPAGGLRAIPEVVRNKQMSMLLKPNKSVFDFGADPVKETSTLPISKTRADLSKNIQAAINDTESTLHEEVARRAEVAHQAGADTGIDVRPYIDSMVDQQIAKAKADGNLGLVRQLNKFRKARIDDLIGQYGSTYLEPEQIIAEKKALSAATDFKADSTSQNLNAMRQKLYQSYDGALNRMFGSDPVTGITSPVKEMNRRMAGLIEADKLNEMQKIADMNRGGDTIYGDIKANMPTTAARTATNRLFGGGRGMPSYKSGAYEYFPKPKPGPYESGYQPTGSVAPQLPGVSPEFTGSIGETATGIHPPSLGNVEEGFGSAGEPATGVIPMMPAHTPEFTGSIGEPATGIHPTTLGDVTEHVPVQPDPYASGYRPVGAPTPQMMSAHTPEFTGSIGEPATGVHPTSITPMEERPVHLRGQQIPIAENALPASEKGVHKTRSFFPGSGKFRQGQLFSESQTPYRWQPTMRETSTMQDLRAMRAEIEQYIRLQKPTGAKLKAWTKDMEDIDHEIYRRVEEQKTPKKATP